MRNVIVAEFSDSNSTTTKRLTRKDYGQILKFEGIDLPVSYEVHFSNIKTNDGTAKTQIGNSDGVLIPNEYLLSGLPIYAWVFLHEGNDDGETCYTVKIPVDSKPSVSPSQPTPVQQDVITQTIAALNEAVETTAEDSAAAVAAKEAIQNMTVSSTTLDPNQTATVEKIVDEETGAVELAFGIPHGYKGDTGTTYTPSVSDEGVISWTNDGDLDNPEPVNIKGQKGDTGTTPRLSVGDVITLQPGSGVTVEITGSDTNPVLNIGIPKGDKGEHGDAFHIVKTYPTILHMNDDYNNPNIAIGEFVMITSDVEDPDNAKVYVKGDHHYNFVVDMSGSAGLKGDTGNGISSISYNHDYSLTFYYTNGSSYTTPSIRGETGLAIMSPMTAGPDYEITIADGAAGRAMTSYEVDLKPVQNGTGDPSPSNYRRLTGWRRVAVYHGGENYANPVEYSYIFGTNTGTIYRGSYDFVSTRLVSSGSVYYITGYMNFTLRTVYSSNNVVRYRYFETTLTESSVRSINIDAYNTHGDVCTHYKVSSSLADSNNTIYYYDHKICIRDDRFTNVADFQAYLREQMLDGTDVVYCGTRVTPSEYYLSDSNEIETLYGINTFWCSDGKISISYDADAKIYIEEHTNGFAAKADTVLDTTLSRGRLANSTVGYGSFAFGGDVTASGVFSHAEGAGTTASGIYAHTEGISSTASGDYSHAEGSGTTASGNSSHAEGTSNIASGVYSHTEGSGTTASSNCAHAEGYQTTASDFNSHAEGSVTTASGPNSHAEGYGSKAKAQASHAEGTYTIAAANSQHAVGMYNVEDTYDNWPEWSANTHYYPGDRVKRTTSDTVYGYTCNTENTDSTFTLSNWNRDNTSKRNFVEIVGIGDSDSNRANGRTLDWQGNEYLAGDVYVGCDGNSTGGTKLAKVTDIPSVPVQDVQVKGTSILNNGVANVPVASNGSFGVIMGSVSEGIGITISGLPYINSATTSQVKAGLNLYRPIVPRTQDSSTFYGLAKAAGSDMASSSNLVGTYTDEAKAAIQHMLGTDTNLAPYEADTTSDAAYAIGEMFMLNGKLHQATAAIALGDTLIVGTNCAVVNVADVFPHDVQVNGVSVVSDGVANVPVASENGYGVVKTNMNYGTQISYGNLAIVGASGSDIQAGTNGYKIIAPKTQHQSTFYGLTKAAGVDMSSSSNPVGTYTDAAKSAIRSMIGATSGDVIAVSDTQPTDPENVIWLPETAPTSVAVPTVSDVDNMLAQEEPDLTSSGHAYAIGDLFTSNAKMYCATAAIAVNDAIVVGTNCVVVNAASVFLRDVQVNGSSIVSNGVASLEKANASTYGLVKVGTGNDGVYIANNGTLMLSTATNSQMKSGSSTYPRAVTPGIQHISTFYGLAKAAGDTTQSASSNAVGTYTESAKSSIASMLNAPESVSGSTPSITAKAGIRYVCGEVATLDITLPASGIVDVVFQSGATPTVLTITPPTGVTVKWANGFDPASLEANTTYEINIADGLGVAASWT